MGLPLALIASCQWVVLLEPTWAEAVKAEAGGLVHCWSLRAMETNGGPGLFLPRFGVLQLGLGWTCWSCSMTSSKSSTAELWRTFNIYPSCSIRFLVKDVSFVHRSLVSLVSGQTWTYCLKLKIVIKLKMCKWCKINNNNNNKNTVEIIEKFNRTKRKNMA